MHSELIGRCALAVENIIPAPIAEMVLGTPRVPVLSP
jgi:hypothetical protein